MDHPFPSWLITISWISIGLGGISFLIVIIDEFRYPQHMWIMDLVWPITALYSSLAGLCAYFKVGRMATARQHQAAKERHETPPNKRIPFWQTAGVGATHCGAGCTLGDLGAEWFTYFVPVILGKAIFGAWAIDFVLAFSLGIAFQYFTIKPMKRLSMKDGIVQALKADTLSLTSWQVGMYGWMAAATFLIFGFELPKSSPVFWLMMQIAMCLGFLTSYPVNWWLIRKGVKEAM
jgi:hypothetical protein